jgi:transcriptional regulator of acetoin/glycerol metabolism
LRRAAGRTDRQGPFRIRLQALARRQEASGQHRDAIAQALARANGVVAQAAADLGLSRQALYRRMERLGIARPG